MGEPWAQTRDFKPSPGGPAVQPERASTGFPRLERHPRHVFPSLQSLLPQAERQDAGGRRGPREGARRLNDPPPLRGPREAIHWRPAIRRHRVTSGFLTWAPRAPPFPSHQERGRVAKSPSWLPRSPQTPPRPRDERRQGDGESPSLLGSTDPSGRPERLSGQETRAAALASKQVR